MILKVNVPDGISKEFKLEDKSTHVAGRSSKASICITTEGVSREHVKIRLESGQLFVTDLGSINGTFINYERLPPNQEIEWPDFFPLHLSANVSIEIIHEQVQEVAKPLSSSIPKQSENPDNSLRPNDQPTKKIANNTDSSPKRPKLISKKKTNPFDSIKKIFPILLVAITAIYFFSTKEQAKNLEVIQSGGEDAKKQETSLAPPSNLISSLSELRAKPACNGDFEKSLCSIFKIQLDQGEGIYYEKNQITLFLDLKHKLLNAELDPSYSSIIDSEKRFKYLLLHNAFITVKRNVREKPFYALLLINLSNSEIKNILIINHAEFVKYTDQDLEQFFSQAQASDYTMVDKFIIPIISYFSAK